MHMTRHYTYIVIHLPNIHLEFVIETSHHFRLDFSNLGRLIRIRKLDECLWPSSSLPRNCFIHWAPNRRFVTIISIIINSFFINYSLLGALYDLTGKYEPAFILAGIAIAFSGLILYFIPPLQRYLANKEVAKNNNLSMVPL